MVTRDYLLRRASEAERQSKHVEFKREFDVASTGAWCDLVKDIAAIANTDGGVIVVGVDDQGNRSDFDVEEVLRLDIGKVEDKLRKYTDVDFPDIEIVALQRHGSTCVAFVVGVGDVPVVFTRPGEYTGVDGKKETAFAKGTLYFRHGGKSEPANQHDVVRWRDRTLARERKAWIDKIRRVVGSPADSIISVVSRAGGPGQAGAVSGTITKEGAALAVVPANAEEIWPYRQTELLRRVNEQLGERKLSSHDLQSLNWKLDVLKVHPEFAYKPHHIASSQYSPAYADWIVRLVNTDPGYLAGARAERMAYLQRIRKRRSARLRRRRV